MLEKAREGKRDREREAREWGESSNFSIQNKKN